MFLYKGHDIHEEIQRLMGREFKSEASIKNNKPNRRNRPMTKVRKAGIPAAGLGTRFLPAATM